MRAWSAERVAQAAGARLAGGGPGSREAPGPAGAAVDSRTVVPGELFVGLRGGRTDGGEHAAAALAAGAWGVLVSPGHAEQALVSAQRGIVLAHPDPLRGLQALAGAWREELGAAGAKVVAITGSTGKTSTKDILAALLSAQLQVVASPQNLNTEIGMPLAMLAAPAGTQALVLEMAMRGRGQIAELAAIARPDVGVIVNIGPVHLELLGSLEAIAAAKAELISALAPDAALVVPVDEPLLRAHLRDDLRTTTFGPGGDVALARLRVPGASRRGKTRSPGADKRRARAEVTIDVRGRRRAVTLRPSFWQAHNVLNLLAAVAGARALGIEPEGDLDVTFSAMRGQRIELDRGIVLIDDCYNANPMSMRAAIDDLVENAAGRAVAVLGDMLELGRHTVQLHREIGAHARAHGVELLVTVGPLAAEMRVTFGAGSRAVRDAASAAELLPALLCEQDTVLVKGSRGVGLERVADALTKAAGAGGADAGSARSVQLAGQRER